MKRIIKIGMDVHTTNYTLCAVEPVVGSEPKVLASTKGAPDYKEILLFIESLKHRLGLYDDYDIECGYEAGYLGYSLYHQLTNAGITCVIMAPSTMLSEKGKRIKTDARDALLIATCLANGGYHRVYVTDDKDTSVKEYIRMRDAHSDALKRTKQQCNALILRSGYRYEKLNWTEAHKTWIRGLDLPIMDRETLNEYLRTIDYLESRKTEMDKRIAEIANEDKYREKVNRLKCFCGIKTHTALSFIVETGDFERFAKGNVYAHFLGLAPGENSSSSKINRLSITKAGNSHLRRLLIEASEGICRGRIGYKSKELKYRQIGNSLEVIVYADRANVRLRKRYYKLMQRGKNRNVIKTAIARELACFIWGMMTDKIA
ncbi:Transposase [Ruminococcaceae bacterium YRB3002]|nr:Transposase [Ruminococcaceae bacterium YRB3002]